MDAKIRFYQPRVMGGKHFAISDVYVGFFNWEGFIKSVMLPKNPFRMVRQRLLSTTIGKLKVEIYNYFDLPIVKRCPSKEYPCSDSLRGLALFNIKFTYFKNFKAFG